MKVTSKGKHSAKGFRNVIGHEHMAEMLLGIVDHGKSALDQAALDLGQLLVESILYMQRESIAGPDYQPTPGIIKGGTQAGSVYIADRKMRIRVPRVRSILDGELTLDSYQAMKSKSGFSNELLNKCLSGLSQRRYRDTVLDAATAMGVSKSTISNHLVELTEAKLKEFLERSLGDVTPFAIFIDSIHRGGSAFVVALSVDQHGYKKPLGFWEGATENSDVCQSLLRELERRGLVLSQNVIWVTDGGSGIKKALREKFGSALLHQRCTVHKSRNIQRHLPKKYRDEAAVWFRRAIDHMKYEDAKGELDDLYNWLTKINISAAASLKEAEDEVLTLHRLRVPDLLRKTLHTTNPIESMFATVRETELNIKRYRDSKMRQRWLATVLLHAEKGFKKVRGYMQIDVVQKRITEYRMQEAA